MVIFSPPLSSFQILPTLFTHPALCFFLSHLGKKKGKQKSRQTKTKNAIYTKTKQNKKHEIHFVLVNYSWSIVSAHLRKRIFIFASKYQVLITSQLREGTWCRLLCLSFIISVAFLIAVILLTICNCHNQKDKIKPLQLQISMEKTVRSNHLSY